MSYEDVEYFYDIWLDDSGYLCMEILVRYLVDMKVLIKVIASNHIAPEFLTIAVSIEIDVQNLLGPQLG